MMAAFQRKKPPSAKHSQIYTKPLFSTTTSSSSYRARSSASDYSYTHYLLAPCDWLICLIFCLGFVVASLMGIILYLLLAHYSLNVNADSDSKSSASDNNDDHYGRAVIDKSLEMPLSEIDSIDKPPPLPPIALSALVNDTFYRTVRDEIDVMKLPHECSLSNQLYECQGAYFDNMTRYVDDWSALVGTQWQEPPDIDTWFAGEEGAYARWNYTIVDYPIIPNFLRSNRSRAHARITIVTQTSMDRLSLVEMVCTHWSGVLSVAIYIRLEESLLHSQQLILEMFERVESVETACMLDIHLLFETDFLYKRTVDRHSDATSKGGLYSVMYPVNHLRNLALQSATTELVLLTDGDFIPSADFHERAVQSWQYATHHMFQNRSNLVMVIPAFELGSLYAHINKIPKSRRRQVRRQTNQKDKERQMEYSKNVDTLDLPLDKSQLVAQYAQDQVRGFHMHRCEQCHSATNYSRWMKAEQPFAIKYKPSFEPYIMAKRVGLHRYDARFRGYGWNKIVHLLSLAWIDRVNWVVPNDLFIFHIPHYDSRDSTEYFKGKSTLKWKWVHGLSKLALRDLKKRIDKTGTIVA